MVAEQAWDVAALSVARRRGRLAEALAASAGGEPPNGHPVPVRKVWHASGGSAGW